MSASQTPIRGTDRKDNAVASITFAAVAGKRHVISDISASYTSTSTDGLLEVIADQGGGGEEVLWQNVIHDSDHYGFQRPILGKVGESLTLTLAASGSASNFGTVNATGWIEEG